VTAPSPPEGHLPDAVQWRHRPGQRWLKRRARKFIEEPPTVRNAVGVIVTVYGTVALFGAVLMRVIDAREYPDFGRAAWWSVQTITTVGYGDVTPADWRGRLVATLVMIQGVAIIAIFVAAITSSFVARAQRAFGAKAAQVGTSDLTDVLERLDRIERLLAGDHPHRTMDGQPSEGSIGDT